MDCLDTLLELAEAESFGETYLKRNGKPGLPAPLRLGKRAFKKRVAIHIFNRQPRWTSEEREYLAAHIGIQNDHQIAAALGRTAHSIKIKRHRWNLPAHSKRPGYLTGNAVAKILAVDIHNIMELCKRNLIPHHIVPGQRHIIAIKQTTLYRWAVNPSNWLYFKPERVTDPHLHRLIQLKAARWNDEWWNVGQVAAYHNVQTGTVGAAIYRGRLPAVRWGNYYILRSIAVKARFWVGKGHGHEIEWTNRCIQFILLASAVGHTNNWIGAHTNDTHQRISHLIHTLHKTGRIQTYLADTNIQYNPTTKQIHIPLTLVASRFPALRSALTAYQAQTPLRKSQILILRAYFDHLMSWHNLPGPRMISISKWSNPVLLDRLNNMVSVLKNNGVEIL